MAIVAAPSGALSATSQTLSGGIPSSEVDWFSSGFGTDYDQLTANLSYGHLYRCQPWAAICVNKLTGLFTQLPRRVLRRMPDNSRVDARGQAYGRLISRPSPSMSADAFWGWVWATYGIYGEAPLLKLRSAANGRTEGFAPIHPSRLRYGPDMGGHSFGSDMLTSDERLTGNRWWFDAGEVGEVMVLRRDLAIWRTYNPHSLQRGMSRMEPLRSTFESLAATEAAAGAVWRQGGRPSFLLKHPKKFRKGTETSRALANQFQIRHGGVENWGKPLVLQEGMDAVPLSIDPGLDYLKIRVADTQTVASMYNIPQPAIGILEKSAFNNIQELSRMVYRDTMPPLLTSFESWLEFEVRDGRFDLQVAPEFGPAFYAETDLAGVLRGTAEDRISANAQAIQTGQLMPSEARSMENRPFVVGSDQLFVNSAVVPVDMAGESSGNQLQLTQMSTDHGWVAGVMGGLSRPDSPSAVDAVKLTEGLDGPVADAVRLAVYDCQQSGGDMNDLRAAIKEIQV